MICASRFPGDSAQLFRILPTGLIETNSDSIDRETPGQQQFTLVVEADDQVGVTVSIYISIDALKNIFDDPFTSQRE